MSNRLSELKRCIIETVKATDTDPITVLRALDPSIRNEFNTLSKNQSQVSSTSSSEISLEMNVYATGARPGETLLGFKQAKKAIVKVYGYIPPDKELLDRAREDGSAWKRFLRNLNSMPFFTDTSDAEKELYYKVMQRSGDIYFEDNEDLSIQLVQLGDGDLLELPEDVIERASNERILAKKFVALFPTKPGSGGLKGRHTLIFRRNIWKVVSAFQEASGWKGIVIDNGDILSSTDKSVYVFDSIAKSYSKKSVEETQSIAIVTQNELEKYDAWEIAKEVLGKKIDVEIVAFKMATKNFTAAAYKSLLQKLIRFRSKRVIYNGSDIPTSHATVYTFVSLMLHPGGFVPDIQRYVSGMEAAFKRLIIILFEDAYVHNEKNALEIITTAFFAQRVSGYKPPASVVKKALQSCVEAVNSELCYDFDIAKGDKLPPLVMKKGMDRLHCISCFVDEIKTFQSDISMIRYILTTQKTHSLANRPEVMPLAHCVDQHWAPEIVYFYPSKYVESVKSDGSTPYSNLMKQIFGRVTGVNPRRPERMGKTMNPKTFIANFEEDEFVIMTRTAQNSILQSKQNVMDTYPKQNTTTPINFTLNDGWISGLIGPVITKGVKGLPPSVVTIRPDEIYEYAAIRKPSRSLKDTSLTEEETEKAFGYLKTTLQTKGLMLTAVPPPTLALSKTRLFLKDEKYVLKKENGKLVEWETFKSQTETIPNIKHIPDSFLTHTGYGIVKDADSIFKKYISTVPYNQLTRVRNYTSSYEGIISLPSVSRNGGATKEAVSIDDVGAFEVLKKIAELYPCALTRKPNQSATFVVNLLPALEHVSGFVEQRLGANKTLYNSKLWGNLGERDKRTLKPPQKESLDKMIASNKRGQTGHFIWMNVGMGKTLLVFSYLRYLKENNKLPKYIIYTLPFSAIASIAAEATMFGFKYTLLIPNVTLDKKYKDTCPNVKHGKTPEPYQITLIEHDHLKKVVGEFLTPATESIFVIDEVHKVLNETLRTAAAHTITSQSQGFVAMTGTPIIDTDTYKLVSWLKRITPFTINENTFFVAANSMVVSLQTNKIPCEYKNIEIPLEGKKLVEYTKLVPASLGGKNSNPRVEDIRAAMDVCYEVCDGGIVDCVEGFLKNKKGVFVVTKDKNHQKSLMEKLVRNGVNRKDIFLIEGGASISFTDETVKSGKTPDYKVVITTLAHNAGYNLTRLGVMITGVYPSNNATREQLEGRINRLGQSAKKLTYITVHCGILSHILDRYNSAKNLSMVLEGLSKE